MSKKETKVKENKKTEKETKTITKKEENKKVDNNIVIVTGLVAAILVILLFINFIFSGNIGKANLKDDIKSVKKILSTKYNDISCVGTKCEYVVGTTGDSLKKTTYNVFNLSGRKVATFKIDYSKKSAKSTDIVDATDNFIITRTTNKKRFSYVLRSTKGKKKYTSKDRIDIINDKLVAARDESSFNIVDKNGKIIISDIDSYDKYADGKYFNVTVKKNKYIANAQGEEALKKYYISEEIKNENDETRFLIVKSTKNDSYSYFDVKKAKIVGEKFDSYTVDEDKNVIISKRMNEETKRYLLKDNGKQVEYTDDTDNVYDKIVKKVDSEKYYVYRYGINSAKQKFVVANDKEKRSLGILNIKNNKFNKLFDYSGTSSSLGAIVTVIDNEKDVYLRITCSKYYCGETQNYIYNLTRNKQIYKENKSDVIISEFALYNDSYKVVKYSYSSDDSEYAGNSFIYDKKNKKVASNDFAMAIVDKKLLVGSVRTSGLAIYSVKEKKVLNKNTNLATKIELGDNIFFRFNTKKNRTLVYKLNGNKIIDIPASSYLSYTNNYIVYLDNNDLKIYNSVNNRTKRYKLRSNEKLNDEFGEMVNPYRGVIVVNNSSNKNVKIVSHKARVLRKIRNVELSTVKKNANGNLLIIVKSTEKSKDVYGLYVAN